VDFIYLGGFVVVVVVLAALGFELRVSHLLGRCFYHLSQFDFKRTKMFKNSSTIKTSIDSIK
jgi:hypothetical protein